MLEISVASPIQKWLMNTFLSLIVTNLWKRIQENKCYKKINSDLEQFFYKGAMSGLQFVLQHHPSSRWIKNTKAPSRSSYLWSFVEKNYHM